MDSNIVNVHKTTLLKTIKKYPKTLLEFESLISIFDKMRVFDSFDTRKLVSMNEEQLDAIYLLLRVSNKIVSDFVDNITQTMCDTIILKLKTSDEMIYDQLWQDINNFVSELVCCRRLKHAHSELISTLSTALSMIFYKNLDIPDTFYIKNKKMLHKLADQLVSETNNHIGTHRTRMINYLNDINLKMIVTQLNINVKKLIAEHCLELDIFVEQSVCNPLNYCIYQSSFSVLHPFIVHNFTISENELLKSIRQKTHIKLDASTKNYIYGKTVFSKKVSVHKIYQLISYIYDCQIVFYTRKGSKLKMIQIGDTHSKKVVIYNDGNQTHTIHLTCEHFIPCYSKKAVTRAILTC